MLTAVRELQIPLLAALLLGGCAAKAWRVLRTRSLTAAMVPTGLLPLRLRRPIMMTMCATELALGLALIATAGRVGAGGPRPARDHRARRDGAVLPGRRGRAERDAAAAAGRRLRLLRRIQRYPDRVADHHPGRRAVRGRRRHHRPAPAPHAVLSRHGRALAGRAGLRAVPHRVPVAGTRRDPGQARLFRAVRAAPAAGRPHADRAALELSVAPVRGPGLRSRPRRRVAGRMLALRGVSGISRAGGESTSSSPSTFRPAGRPSGWRSSTRTPTRSSAGRNWRVCRYLGDSRRHARRPYRALAAARRPARP